MATRKKKLEVDTPAVEEGAPGGARSFWSGTLSFGLVTVPVELFAAQRSTRASLRMLTADGTPLSRQYYAEGSDEPLSSEEIERGYALDDGRMITVTDEELAALMPEQSRDIDLRSFVPADAIDPRVLDRAYVLAPAGKSTTAYRLLAAVMERSKRVGIATFVMRGKQYLVAISAEHGLLRAETMRFQDELRTPESIGLARGEPGAADVKRMRSIVHKLIKRDFALTELKDEATERLTKLVEQKRKKREDVVAPPEVEESAEGGAEVIDLLAVLRESLARDQKRAPVKAKPARSKRAK